MFSSALEEHADLTPSELTDLYASVQKVGRAVEKAYDGHSLTISCQ
jgi:diadenosine tetraphosphate (Ap4A) HIT family hydrolase